MMYSRNSAELAARKFGNSLTEDRSNEKTASGKALSAGPVDGFEGVVLVDSRKDLQPFNTWTNDKTG